MIQCSRRRNGRPGAVWPSSKTTMSGKSDGRLRPFVERLVIFEHLPRSHFPADQQNESGRGRDFLGKLGRPGTAGPHVRGGEEYARGGILALDGGLEPLRQRLIRRMIAEKPARHSSHRVEPLCTRDLLPTACRNATGPPTRRAWQDIELSGISQRGCRTFCNRSRKTTIAPRTAKIIIVSTAAMHTRLQPRVIQRQAEVCGRCLLLHQ